MHPLGYLYEDYHDARSLEHKVWKMVCFVRMDSLTSRSWKSLCTVVTHAPTYDALYLTDLVSVCGAVAAQEKLKTQAHAMQDNCNFAAIRLYRYFQSSHLRDPKNHPCIHKRAIKNTSCQENHVVQAS